MADSFLPFCVQRPSYHYFRMLVDPDYEPPVIATFDDEVNLRVSAGKRTLAAC